MNISVSVDGRGQSYKTNLIVDPLEQLESCFKTKTHFWNTFMMRGQHKCMVIVTNKNEEDTIVAPDYFKQSFKDIGVAQGAQIVLHEFKNFNLSDQGDEGGEDENEEMEEAEEEVEEQQPENADEEKPEVVAEAQDDDEGDKKASELLFGNEGEQKTTEANQPGH